MNKDDQMAEEKYSNFVYIGEGGFSTVYKATYVPEKSQENPTGKPMTVAVKKMNVKTKRPRLHSRIYKTISRKTGLGGRNYSDGNYLRIVDVENEATITEAITSFEFIIDLIDCFFSVGDQFWMVFEFTLGDLHWLIKLNKNLPRNQKKQRYLPIHLTKHILSPILLALKHMHENGFAHRDVKEDNILITERGVPKLSDFGSAKEFETLPMKYEKKGPGGTFYYMAPEVLRLEDYTTACDVWGIGITFLSVAYGGKPFELKANFNLSRLHDFLTKKTAAQDEAHAQNSHRVSAQKRFYRLASLETKPISNFDDDEFQQFAQFVKKLLVLEQSERISMSDACSDDYMAFSCQNWLGANVRITEQKLAEYHDEVNEESKMFIKNCREVETLFQDVEPPKQD